MPATQRDMLQPNEKRDAATTLAEADVAQAPAAAVPPPAPSVSGARKQAARAPASPATDRTGPPPASLAAAPQPFPAEKKVDSGESAESTDIKSRASAAPATEPAAAPPDAQYSGLARKDERQRAAPAAAKAMGLDKTSSNAARLAQDYDVDAWIVRIRKLHDDGKLPDAANELRALRRFTPDAEGRLPPELRAWAATVKP